MVMKNKQCKNSLSTLAGFLFMLVHSYTLYQQAGSFLIEDLYKLNLSATEQLWISWHSSCMLKIPIIPFHGKQMCKSTSCRYNAFWNYVENGAL
jgi:NADH-quinone oxidoreductase subunit M